MKVFDCMDVAMYAMGLGEGALILLMYGFLTLAPNRINKPPYHWKHDQEKRREYDQCVCDVEHATFTPLVLSTILER